MPHTHQPLIFWLKIQTLKYSTMFDLFITDLYIKLAWEEDSSIRFPVILFGLIHAANIETNKFTLKIVYLN